MRVEIDTKSGFCFGVVRAIEVAQSALEAGSVCCLGDIVHNSLEVQRLEKLGLTTIAQSDFKTGQRIIIRAHGEPPMTYALAKQVGVELIDATCPVVARLQQRVKRAWEKMQEVDGQVVILGKKGHAEVVGLEGQIDGNAIVVESEADLDTINFEKPIFMLSQTTQSLEFFDKISTLVNSRAKARCEIADTICRQVAGRAPHLKEFANNFDVIIFVCGKKSSNGKALFEVCRSVNKNSYQVEGVNDLNMSWFDGVRSVGICGATSTPLWQMESVYELLKDL